DALDHRRLVELVLIQPLSVAKTDALWTGYARRIPQSGCVPVVLHPHPLGLAPVAEVDLELLERLRLGKIQGKGGDVGWRIRLLPAVGVGLAEERKQGTCQHVQHAKRDQAVDGPLR